MLNAKPFPAVILIWSLTLSAFAQDAAQAITPLLTSRTLAVAQIDLQRLDLNTAEKLLVDVLPLAQPDVPRREKAQQEIVADLKQAREWQARLRDAGARQLFGLLTLEGAMSAQPGYLFVSVDPGKAQAVADILGGIVPRGEGAGAWAVEPFSGGVFIGPKAMLQGLRDAKPQPRPEILEALAAADGQVRAAIAPTADVSRALAALAPPMPAKLGGGTAESLVRGLKWIAVSANLAVDNSTARLVIAAHDAPSAQALARMLSLLADSLAAATGTPAARDVLARLKVAPDQSHRLVVALERKPTLALATEMMQQARVKASMELSMSHMRQILLASLMHANDREGQWPENLQALVDARYLERAEVLKNPRSPGGAGAYVYVKPKAPLSRLQSTTTLVILHEPLEGLDGKVAVGFADGHVDLLSVEEARKKLAQ